MTQDSRATVHLYKCIFNTSLIEDEDGAESIFQIARYQRAISLSSCGIPQLEAMRSALMEDILAHKIYADGWLYLDEDTFSFS